MSKNLGAMGRFVKSLLVVGPIVLCVQVVGVFSPAWLVLTRDNVLIQEGIWYTRACDSMENDCVISSREWIYMNAVDSKTWTVLTNQNWVMFKSLTLVAIYSCCVAIVCSYIVAFCKYGQRQTRSILVFGGSHMLASCCLLLIPSIKTALVMAQFSTPWTDCWSRNVAVVGSILALGDIVLFTLAVTMGCVHSMKRRRTRHRRHGNRDARMTMSVVMPISPPSYSDGAPPAYSDIYNSTSHI